MRRHDPRQDRNEAGATDLPWGNKGHAPQKPPIPKNDTVTSPSGRTAGARDLKAEKKSGSGFCFAKMPR